MKHRGVCETAFKKALKEGKSVVVDRCNFDYLQRQVWIKLAVKFEVKRILCLHLDVPKDVCVQRIKERKDHPTIQNASDGISIIQRFSNQLTTPRKIEGFAEVFQICKEEQVVGFFDFFLRKIVYNSS